MAALPQPCALKKVQPITKVQQICGEMQILAIWQIVKMCVETAVYAGRQAVSN
jgi:hypothetical protein